MHEQLTGVRPDGSRPRTPVLTTPEGERIDPVEEYLGQLLARLRAVMDLPPAGEDDLVTIMSIYNELGFVSLYCEATCDEATRARLRPLVAAFNEDTALAARMVDFVTVLSCRHQDVESARQEYERLCRALCEPGSGPEDGTPARLAEARAIAATETHGQRAVLEPFGVAALSAPPPALYSGLISRLPDAGARSALGRAWRAQRAAHAGQLTPAVDRVVAARRAHSAAEGHPSVLARSLAGSGIGTDEIDRFLDASVPLAIGTHTALEAEIADLVGVSDERIAHFGFAVRTAFGAAPAPRLPLHGCLDYLFEVGRSALGLTLRRRDDADARMMTYDVYDDAGLVGRIVLDLWHRPGKPAANHTAGIRNRTAWHTVTQRPVSYVACSFPPGGAADGLRPAAVRTLFHEFGHAVNHLLIGERLPHAAGLERVPVERSEGLALWFEKWVHHEEFARHLALDGEAAAALRTVARIKRLEDRCGAAEQAIAAALDVELHRGDANDPGDRGGLAEAYARLDARYGVSQAAEFADFPAYFVRPAFTTRPGLYLRYPWGAAESATQFAPYEGMTLAEVADAPRMRQAFTPYFRIDGRSAVPDHAALSSLYASASLTAES